MKNSVFTVILYVLTLCLTAHLAGFFQGHMKVTSETWEENITYNQAQEYLGEKPKADQQYYLETSVSRIVEPTGFLNFETTYDTLSVSIGHVDLN